MSSVDKGGRKMQQASVHNRSIAATLMRTYLLDKGSMRVVGSVMRALWTAGAIAAPAVACATHFIPTPATYEGTGRAESEHVRLVADPEVRVRGRLALPDRLLPIFVRIDKVTTLRVHFRVAH
jgi:hypothetical protein